MLVGPSQKAHTWPCKPWCLHFSPTKPLVAFLGLFPCYIRAACLALGAAPAHGRERSEVFPWGSVGTGPGLPAQCVCSCSESLAALGQLMVGGKPPCWLAPSREQAAHSDVDGGEQLCEHVSLRSLTFCLSQNPLVSFFSVCAVLCPLHSALGREGCHLCKS